MSENLVVTAKVDPLKAEIRRNIGDLKGRKIIVVGDVGLDEYVMGDVRRISPEAPVPVLEVRSQDSRMGLAANVAQNVASLGGTAWLLSVIGADAAGEQLKGQLREVGVSSEHLIVDRSRPTTRKLRVMSGHHHLVRVDFEQKRYLEESAQTALLKRLEDLVPEVDAVIIEDYAKGVLSETALAEIIRIAHKHKKKVLADPHPQTPARFYTGVDLLTPNREEAIALSGVDADELRDRESLILEIGESLRGKIKAEQLVITRGSEGMTVFEREKVVHFPTYARQVFDVTGAGDTVIAALGLAWGAGWPLDQACVLANFAAGVVVGKVGCVPCQINELLAYMDSH
jgi:D-glycero-beta-D-manno-heptose-7-phosphate kinase